jgi:hypothetical protein
MTETQAKSGATGASTEADDSPVEAGAGGAARSAGESARADESPDKAADSASEGEEASNVAETQPPAMSLASSTLTSRPTIVSPAAIARVVVPAPTAKAETSVPVVAVAPASVPPTSPPVATGTVGASSAVGSAGASVPPAKSATGTASAAPGPVIARASVAAPPAPPAGPTTTVSGTGIRQTSGTTSVVSPGRLAGAAAVGAARVSEAVRSARATVAGAASRGPRRARLNLKRIDPWSVMKFSFVVSVVLFVVAIVATSVLYLALDAMGVFNSLNQAMADVAGNGSSLSFKITAKGVIFSAILLGAVNMVLFTALMTLGAFVYNVCADLVGGVELTLSEKE